jgi:hypothetical protein
VNECQPGTVAGFGGFAEEFGEALSQLADAQALERRYLVDDVQLQRVLLSLVGEVNPCAQ